MKRLVLLNLLGIFLLIISCEKKEKEKDISSTQLVKNNSAILTGSSIGNNTANITDLRKIGKVLIQNVTNDFHVDTVYFCRSSVSSNYIYWILPVRNISNNPHAFIKATGIRFLDMNNNLLYEDDMNYTYVYGSCCALPGSTLYLTETFLGNNEAGYFLGINNMDFSKVARISLETIKCNNDDYVNSNMKVVPTSYQVSDDYIQVNIINQSQKTLYVWSSPVIYLDNDNSPVYWTFINPDLDYVKIEKAVSSWTVSTLYGNENYQGNCRKIQPILTYKLESIDYKSANSEDITNDNDELFRQRIKERDIRLNQK